MEELRTQQKENMNTPLAENEERMERTARENQDRMDRWGTCFLVMMVEQTKNLLRYHH